jgi:hypothetical protein
MNSRIILAVLITALGAVIAAVNLREGVEFSFPLLLGLLLVADGLLRLGGTSDEQKDG